MSQEKQDVYFWKIFILQIVARASGIETLEPNIDEGVRMFMTGGDKQYERLMEYGKAKIGKKQIANESFLMCIRQSMKNYLEKLNELISFEDGVLFYGMWKGSTSNS